MQKLYHKKSLSRRKKIFRARTEKLVDNFLTAYTASTGKKLEKSDFEELKRLICDDIYHVSLNDSEYLLSTEKEKDLSHEELIDLIREQVVDTN